MKLLSSFFRSNPQQQTPNAAFSTPKKGESQRPLEHSHHDTCVVCLGNIDVAAKGKMEGLSLDCQHRFHKDCIARTVSTAPNGMRCPLCKTEASIGKRVELYNYLSSVNPSSPKTKHNLGLVQIRHSSELGLADTDSEALRERSQSLKLEGITNLVHSIEMDHNDANAWQSLAQNWPDNTESMDLRLSVKGGRTKLFKVSRLIAYGRVLQLDPNNQVAMRWIDHLQKQA